MGILGTTPAQFKTFACQELEISQLFVARSKSTVYNCLMESNKDERARKAGQGEEVVQQEPVKRQKAGDNDGCEPVVVETVEENETEVADHKIDENKNEQRELMCILCMEEGSVESPLLNEHQCAQCNKDAWKICACCNETILSRICPVCRGNYAPILLHVIPGIVL